MHDLYSCATPSTIQPVLPQFGSDLRTFFLNALGLTDSPTYALDNPCVIDTLPNTTPIRESDGRQILGSSWIGLYSVANYSTQTIGVAPDRHGVTILRGINGRDPHTGVFPPEFVGPVFNVVRTADRSDPVLGPLLETAFAGPNSQVCQDPSLLIERYGLSPIHDCGFVVN